MRLTHMAPCAGCAAKLSPMLLKEALKSLPRPNHPNLLVGSDTMDDAGVYKIRDDLAIISTTDFFTPIVDDPTLFGEIAATNAMSDVYAMGGEVTMALNLLSFPKTLPLEILHAILDGAQKKVQEASGVIVGGHTVATETLMFGLAVTGMINPNEITANNKLKPGDLLILTKPLGTGIITTAIRSDKISPSSGEEAFHNMTLLNKGGAEVMQKYKVKAATDITGFGILGHSGQMAQASEVTIELNAQEIPLMEGVKELAEKKVVTGAERTNREYTTPFTELVGKVDSNLYSAFLDPQTSGGLLFAIDEKDVDAAILDLKEKGYKDSKVIGKVKEKASKAVNLNF